MGFAALTADGFLPIHACSEDKSQDTAHFLIENSHGYLSFLDEFLELVGQIIVVVAEFGLFYFAIREGSHLNVKASRRCLPRICGATPVTDDGTIPFPIVLQHPVQQLIVLTTVHTFIIIIACHDGPNVRFLNSSLVRCQI